ncbi:MAG: hypothetical protein NZ898_14135 [Myxococcota bacterium]|nr:hypothetical protein [Myxococcota bacterium]MDW8360959.1 hypothetical protein [Myxococcales bacterium]
MRRTPTSDPPPPGSAGETDGHDPPKWPPSRLTLTFDGPRLRLPDEPVSGEVPLGPDATMTPPLEVDLDELAAGRERSAPRPAADPSPRILELDMSDVRHDTPAHDAWTVERVRRGSRPPSSPRLGSVPGATAATPRNDSGPMSVLESDGALSLVDRVPPLEDAADRLSDVADLYALGDFSGALRAAELVLGADPDNEEARRYARSARERLVQMYSARLGSPNRVPRVVVAPNEVRWLGIDHRAGFLLSCIDGRSSIDELVDVSGMDRLEVLRTLVTLLEAGAIEIGEPCARSTRPPPRIPDG